jgi:hypothetical protein
VFGSFVLAAGLLFVNVGLDREAGAADSAAFYQAVSAASAVAFFSLGAMFWGGCYLVGVTFLVLIPVMAIDPRFCPIEYGSVWAVVCTRIGLRLRKLAKEQQAAHT